MFFMGDYVTDHQQPGVIRDGLEQLIHEDDIMEDSSITKRSRSRGSSSLRLKASTVGSNANNRWTVLASRPWIRTGVSRHGPSVRKVAPEHA